MWQVRRVKALSQVPTRGGFSSGDYTFVWLTVALNTTVVVEFNTIYLPVIFYLFA